jgi:hypothetical protein
VLLQHPNDLIFREPCSLHLSVLQEGRTLNPRGGKSQGQVKVDHINKWSQLKGRRRFQFFHDYFRHVGGNIFKREPSNPGADRGKRDGELAKLS